MFIQAAISSCLLGASDRKVAPSTGPRLDPQGPPLQRRSVAAVQPSHRRCTDLTVDDGKGLQRLPDGVLEIVAATASDDPWEAGRLISALTSGRSEEKAETSGCRDSGVTPGMLRVNPRLAFNQLLRDLNPAVMRHDENSFEYAQATLERRALLADYPLGEVRAWLSDDRTVGALLAKHPGWMKRFETPWLTQGAITAYLEAGGYLDAVPREARTHAVWLAATSGPGSRPETLGVVPAEHRTHELLCAAVAKHPRAYQYVKYSELSLPILRAAYAESVRG